MRDALASYAAALPIERRALIDEYAVADACIHVGGTGSVGLRSINVLLQGARRADILLLQLKEATTSALAPYLPGMLDPGHDGQRVVHGQRLIQAAGDILLGSPAALVNGRAWYVRQRSDWAFDGDADSSNPKELLLAAGGRGTVLARGHARSGDRFAIAGYLGKSSAFADGVTAFALRYADVVAADHAAVVRWRADHQPDTEQVAEA